MTARPVGRARPARNAMVESEGFGKVPLPKPNGRRKMPGSVRLASLPEELEPDDAVEIAYGDSLDWVEAKLRRGLSVLVECDKQIVQFLYRKLRDRLKDAARGEPKTVKLLAGRPKEGERGGSVLSNVLLELGDAVLTAERGTVVVVPHLDILTTTTKSGLSMEAREAIARFYENPDAVVLGFKDPSFEIPKVVEDLFTARRLLIGIPRESLPKLVRRQEARKLGVDEFDPYSLYKFVSGVNVIKLRRILAQLENRLDFDPAHPSSRVELLREIREMTLTGDMEVPRVDLRADIGGYAAVKEKLESEILSLLRRKDAGLGEEEVKAIEGLLPRGIVFSGPPGTGKTFFAKALATAIDATCIVVSGPELKSKWYGESEENLRRIFARARRAAPAVIVFDELDSIASSRGLYQGGNGVDHSIVNQLLTEMDGFRREELVFVVGTTNFVESLDPALLRPGRFEFVIDIPWPVEDDRREIARIYRDRFRLNIDDLGLEHLVRRTGGAVDPELGGRWTGDHLQALFRALKREEIRRGGREKFVIDAAEIDKAMKTRGAKRTLTPEEERTIAIHETGHALCALLLPNASPFEKVTIETEEEDRLGYVLQEVRKNRYVTTRADLLDDLAVCLGGRIAERLRCADVSIGAWDDLRRASEIARLMIEELGMGDGVDLRSFAPAREGAPRPPSPERARRIDEAIDQLLREQNSRVQRLLEENGALLDEMAARLLEKKSLTRDEALAILASRTPRKAAGVGT